MPLSSVKIGVDYDSVGDHGLRMPAIPISVVITRQYAGSLARENRCTCLLYTSPSPRD